MSSQALSISCVLRVQGLDFGFVGRSLFRGWSADFPAGLSLVEGGDGAGKTSLLRLLAGECTPQAGTVTLLGMHAARPPAAYQSEVFWRDPRAAWPDTLTPQAWMGEVSVRHSRWSPDDWRAHVEGFGLAAHLSKPMYQLSSGSQRKVLLAAALASGAVLTLLDEPLAALDKPSISYLLHALAMQAHRFHCEGRVVIVAHYDALPTLPWRCKIVL